MSANRSTAPFTRRSRGNSAAHAQRVVATWFALSALLSDLQTRSTTKFPASDRQFVFANRQPPPHWFIFLGQYAGTTTIYPFAANNAFFNVREGDGAGTVKCALQVKTVTMGHLYGAVIVHSPPHLPGMTMEILRIHHPWLVPLQPMLVPCIRFPRPVELSIRGELESGPTGGLAMDLATRYVKRFGAIAEQVRKAS